MSKSMYFPCPHCKAPSFTRSVLHESNLRSKLRLQCSDAECGHTFEVQTEVLYTIRQSAIPDPGVCVRSVTPMERVNA